MLDVAALRRLLLTAVGVVAGLGLGIELVHAQVCTPALDDLLDLLSLSQEANVPTWWSSSLLLACAVAAGVVAARRPPLRWHWWGMTAVAGWMSLDEATELHEHLAGLVDTSFDSSGLLYFNWVLPATIIVLALALAYVPFVRALAVPTRTRLVVAAAVYITGALVMELPLGAWTDHHGTEGLGYALIDWVEETMEMVGSTLALVALVRHRQEHA